MRGVFEKIGTNLPSGLAAKLIRAVVIIFFLLGLEFFATSNLQVRQLERFVKTEGSSVTGQVETESRESMDNLIRNSLEDLSVRAADKTDDELWVNAYELSILGAQAEDVLSHPENYARIPVLPPDKKNAGKLALQLLAPNGYENIDPKTMETMERLANLAPIMKTYIGEYTVDIYISTPDGVTIAMDKKSDGKFDEDGNVKPYDATTRPWFKDAVRTGDQYFGPAVHSFFYDYNIVVYSRPVYVDGKLAAVLEGSLNLDALNDRVEYVLLGDTGFNVLISRDGQLVSTSRTDGELSMRDDLDEDIRGTVNPSLVEIIDDGLSGGSGTAIVQVDGEDYYAGFGPLVTVGWTQISFVSTKEMMEPTERLVEDTATSFDGMIDRLEDTFRLSRWIMLLIMGAIVILSIIIVSRMAKKRVAPINHMTKRVNELSGKNMIFEMEDIYKTGDEIETLAKAFETQSDRLMDYVAENIRISTEKERIDAEMSMAARIQESMLPRVTTAFSERSEFTIFANMTPAINVGGDFYDFFYIDDDHLAIEVADVSGKGITAALFMALSKQMIQSQMIIHNGDIAESLSVANIRLLEESVRDMFVTVWLGVLTLSTGELVFADAGHEYPAIQRAGGDFEIYKDNHSVTVAAIKKAKFKMNEIKLNPGDTIYLFTDGVTEAHNPAGDMFGMERLSDALNEVTDAPPEEIDTHVRKRIAEFAGDAEQYDDITTLCLKYLGNG